MFGVQELVRRLGQSALGGGDMKYRIGIWATVGFLMAGFWALYAVATNPPGISSGDRIMILVRLTCPIALFSSYPLRFYWVLLANAATYALVGLIVETLRQGLKRGKIIQT
jgi:hypothetical protein